MKRVFFSEASLLRYLNGEAAKYSQSKDPTEFDDLIAEMGLNKKHRVTLKLENKTLDYNEIWELFDAKGEIKIAKN